MRVGVRKRLGAIVCATTVLGLGGWAISTAAPAAADPALTISKSTGLKNGTKVTYDATGFTPMVFGSITECNGDPTAPTVTIQGNQVPVGCSAVALAIIPASGEVTGTFKVIEGTTGPPAGGTDSAGNPATADAPNYPCPPTQAQIDAGITCAIAFGDTTGAQAYVIIHFADEPPPDSTTTTSSTSSTTSTSTTSTSTTTTSTSTTTSTTSTTTSTTSTTTSTTSTTTSTTLPPTTTSTTMAPSTKQVVGGCDGGVSLGKIDNGSGGGLTDTNQAISVSTASLKTAIAGTVPKGTVVAGGCNILGSPVAPTKVSAKLSSTGASCASAAVPGEDPTAGGTAPASYPLNGKLSVKEGANGLSTYVSVLGFNPAAQDILDVGGIVTKGDLVGAQVSGNLYEDPAVKDTVGDANVSAFPGEDGNSTVKPKVPPTFDGVSNTGYSLDLSGLAALGACADGVAGDLLPANGIKTVLVGSGPSVLKQFAGTPIGVAVLGAPQAGALSGEASATGLTFTFGE